MTIVSLLEDYRAGRATPSAVVEDVLARRSGLPIWISGVAAAALRERARVLEQLRRDEPDVADRLPLFGVPYAVKDNIDAVGLDTTAGCPAFAYRPARSSTVVERLEAAGAVLVGKTNLDQFATGLVGTRSPYGVVPNAFDPEYVSGGSSSGSAVAVARGEVLFALGTDTAGSGRVPAGLNNLVGLKPSRGLVSARGVVPACQSLDCVSLFALTVADAVRVFDVTRGFDAADPYARELALWPDRAPAEPRLAFPSTTEFYGDACARDAFALAVASFDELGASATSYDLDLFQEAAALLYEGPWVAERMATIGPFLAQHPDDVHPVVRRIIEGATAFDAASVFRAVTRLHELQREAARLFTDVDALVVPTVPTVYRINEVLAEPLTTNRRLGYYTNFVNLLDLAAIAVPGPFRSDGLPAGVTLIGPAGSDRLLADLAQRFHHAVAPPLAGTGKALPPAEALGAGDGVSIAVAGAHLRGLALSGELLALGARFEREARTTPRYRLVALAGAAPARPGLVRDGTSAIAIETWRLSREAFGIFVSRVAAPLSIGSIELEDGSRVPGFLCESWAADGAEDISSYGGWRAYLAR